MKRTLLAACLCSLYFFANSQNCQPASNCADAPILCGFYLNGLQAETLPFQSVETWAPFVCGTIENNTWLAFTPCETSVALEIQVFSCNGSPGGTGMQAEIYQTEDCFAIIPVGSCLEQVFPGTSGVIEAQGLIPGEVYYLMLDGWNGDFCQYQINVLQGIDISPPQPVDCSQATPGYIAGDAVVSCDANGQVLGEYQLIPPTFPGGGGCPAPEFDCIEITWNVPPGATIVSANLDNTQVTIDFTNASSGWITVDFEENPQCACFCGDFCVPALEADYSLFVTVQAPPGCLFPAACPNPNLPVPPADNCADAPSFCSGFLQGYCSNNAVATPDTPGNLAAVFSCNIQNNQWLRFTACHDTAHFELSVEDCLSGEGLQFAVLQSFDCQNFSMLADCFTLAEGTSGTLVAPGLTVGQTYFFMLDGAGGDVCSWQILSAEGVSNGVTVQEDNTPGHITNLDGSTPPASVCLTQPVILTLTFTPPVCNLLPVNDPNGCPFASQQICQNPQPPGTCAFDTVWQVEPPGAIFVNGDSTGAVVSILFPDTLDVPPGGFLEFTISVSILPVPLPNGLPCHEDCLTECLTVLADSDPCAILPHKIKLCKPDVQEQYFLACPENLPVIFQGQPYFCGDHVVSKTDPCGCTDVTMLHVFCHFEPPASASQPVFQCDASGDFYTVSYTFSPPFYTYFVNGSPVSGNGYTSPPFPSGQSYNLLVTPVGTCQQPSFTLYGSHTCPCQAETSDLGIVELCPGECFDLQGTNYCSVGSYSEQFTDAGGCTDTYLFTIEVQNPPPLSIGIVTTDCDATNLNYWVTFTISAGTPPYFVNGLPSGGTYVSSPIPTGQSFSFTVTDSGVCGGSSQTIAGTYTCDPVTFSGTMNLSVMNACGDEIVATAWNNDATLDANDALVFVLHDSPNNLLGNLLWQNSTGAFSFDPVTMSYGYAYFVSAVAGNAAPGGGVDFNDPNLSVSQGQPVIFHPIPSLDLLAPDTLTCIQTSVMLTALTDLPGSTIMWSAPGFFSTEQNPVVAAAGSYACKVTDPSGNCSASASVQVTIDTLPPGVAVFDAEITCQTPVVQLLATTAMPGVSLTWTLPDGSILTGGSISTNLTGDYLVQAAASNGCTSQASAEVTDASVPPDIYVFGGDIVCSKPATLTATSNSSGVVFTWILPDGTTAAGSNISAAEPGIYFATATDPAGCTNEAEAQVGQTEPVIEPFFEVKMPTCFGWEDGYIRLGSVAGGAAPYLILPEFPLENLGAAEFALHLTDANGCEADALILLENPPPVTVWVGNDTTILAGESVELVCESNVVPAKIQWESSAGLTAENQVVWSVRPAEDGTFWVVVEDENGCSAADSLRIFLETGGQIFVPNAFSPNGDGKNDRLTIFTAKDVAQVRSFRIFDRWGDLVFVAENFQPDDFTKGWDGTAKGKALDPAVFVFLAEIEMKSGEVSLISGDVTLVR